MQQNALRFQEGAYLISYPQALSIGLNLNPCIRLGPVEHGSSYPLKELLPLGNFHLNCSRIVSNFLSGKAVTFSNMGYVSFPG